ncbi:hypothetical protein T8T21_00650 [Limimaricola variabilis]|uniref:hypothetical protein n=1 Tax=Limimaricola variabilis TaxID=1492771 RepID=UPI002AC924A2|nr:hypothetical protein [Limimaricola variabilis]WPY94668.1 hypothetical protein T8T21_00650 [Limimaricola variabilis]
MSSEGGVAGSHVPSNEGALVSQLFSDLFREVSKGKAVFPSSSRPEIDWHRPIFVGLEAAVKSEESFLLSEHGHIEVHRGRASIGFGFEGIKPPYLFRNASLSADGLRRIFTRLEFLVFASIKWDVYQHDGKYLPETESFSERVKFLKGRGRLRREDEDALRLIKATRDEFAHSTLAVKDLFFSGLPLSRSFPDLVANATRVAIPLEGEFMKVQERQVDWRIFNIVVNGMAC